MKPRQRFFTHLLKPENASPIIEEFRTLFEYVNREGEVLLKTAKTTDATVTDIATIALDEGDVVLVEAQIVAKETDETNRALYHIEGLFYRNTAGNVTQQGATAAIATAIESDATWACTLNADTTAQTVDLRVTGKAATTIRWKAVIKIIKVG